MVQACGDPFAVGTHYHSRVRMAHLRGDIQWQRVEHEQVGGEGVARLLTRIDCAATHGTRDCRRKAFCHGRVHGGIHRRSSSFYLSAVEVSAGQGR